MPVTPRTISVGIVSLGACAITNPETNFPVGGSELQLYLLGLALTRANGFRVTLYVADAGQLASESGGVRVQPLVRVSPSLRLPAVEIIKAVRRLARGRHDVYCTRSASSVNGLTRLAAWMGGGRYLHFCAHDDECNGRGDATLSRPARWLHHLGLCWADAVVCQSDGQRESLRTALHRDSVVIPNLCPAALRPPEGQERKGVLWVGRDVAWKQPELFLEMARRLPAHPFTMVCQPQPGRDLDRLRRSAPGNLRIIPGLPFVETARLFGEHLVLVTTSAVEGFPNVLLQAASAGTPIVSLSVNPGGILCRHGAGFACEGDLEEMFRRTETLLTVSVTWEDCHGGTARVIAETAEAEERIVNLVRHLAGRERVTSPSPDASSS